MTYEVREVSMKWTWPDREQWAKNRRSWYGDDANPLAPANRVSDFASPDEIGRAILELKEQWTALGREMSEAKEVAWDLLQQKGEDHKDFVRRYYALTDAQQDLASRPNRLQHIRKRINEVIKDIGRNDSFNWYIHQLVLDNPPSPKFVEICARYTAALKKANDEYAEQVENTPIDDAAWAEELRRRAECERR